MGINAYAGPAGKVYLTPLDICNFGVPVALVAVIKGFSGS